jgi:thermitase
MKCYTILSLLLLASPAFAGTRLLIKANQPVPGARMLSGATSWQVLELEDGAQKSGLMAELLRDPAVEWVEEDFRVRVDPILPNDAQAAKQWALIRLGVFEAWKLIPASAPEILVAVIDTGVEGNHPDLREVMFTNPGEIPGNGRDDDGNGLVDDVSGWNFEADDADASDDFHHGTHVAGIIGAKSNNRIGVSGIAPRVRILPIRWMKKGLGWGEDAIESIHYAVKMGARVINASWGGIGYSKALEEAIREAEKRGVLFVSSAGNGKSDNDVKPHHPANLVLSNTLSVASVDENDRLEKYSNYGKTKVDFGAPGKEILSTMMSSNYGSLSGTSMAAAVVSGSAALILSARPDLKAQDLKRIFSETVVPAAGLREKTRTGGRVDTLGALRAAIGRARFEKRIDADDSDLSGEPLLREGFIAGELIRPDRVEEGSGVSGLSLKIVRKVKGVDVPVEGVSFRAQTVSSGTSVVLRSDAEGAIRTAACDRDSFQVTAYLENPHFRIVSGNAPYELGLKIRCGVDQRFVFEEASPAGQVIGIWQTATTGGRKLSESVGLQFWKRTIDFEWPAKGDYYSMDRVRITRGDHWDVVGHEMGHAIYDQAGIGVFGGGQHYIDQCYTEAMAISEGWASFYSAWVALSLSDPDARFEYMVPRRAPIRIENIPADVCGKQTNEWRASGFFWDLVDLHADGEGEQSPFARLWADTAGARASSVGKIKARLIQKGWSPERLETIWKLNFPGE